MYRLIWLNQRWKQRAFKKEEHTKQRFKEFIKRGKYIKKKVKSLNSGHLEIMEFVQYSDVRSVPGKKSYKYTGTGRIKKALTK